MGLSGEVGVWFVIVFVMKCFSVVVIYFVFDCRLYISFIWLDLVF